MAHQVASKKTYYSIFAALLVLTFTTVAVTYVEMGRLNLVIAMAIAFTKASLVVFFFMEVKQSSALTKLFIVGGLFWLAILMVLTFSDYLSRAWLSSPQAW
jgi:cytochrome c oxidase subunit IV